MHGVIDMQLICHPEIKKESALPLYVTGVGVGDVQLSCSCGGERLFVVSEGCAKINIGGETYDLDKGSVCWLGHEYLCVPEMNAGSAKIHWVTFDTAITLPEELFVSQDHAVFAVSDFSSVTSLFRSIYDALTLDSAYGGFTASAHLYSLLIRLNRDASKIPDGMGRMNPAIASTLDFISENYTDAITLEKLCEAAGGLSEQYLCRLFKQTTGMRPMEYILKKRITAARSYLENTDMPISEIAVITGFNNTSYFYRNFKKFTGMSPLVCRQNAYGKTARNRK